MAWRTRPGRWPLRWCREDGATMVEYGLLVALISVVVAAGAATLGLSVGGSFDNAANLIVGAPAEPAPDDEDQQPGPDQDLPAAEAGGGGTGAAKDNNGKSSETNGHGKGAGGGKDHK